MLVFRITQKEYAHDLSGFGAKQFGGRWNSIGTPILYTSSSASLAILENLVHLPKHLLPKNIVLITFEIPDNLPHSSIIEKGLPKNWRHFPVPLATQKIGDILVKENKNLYLEVPSTVVISEMNVLINVNSSHFNKIKILDVKPFTLDVRLFK